ncbi:DUF882 domain-containing protein [Thiomonas sp. FB-6]|uniref:DUF882 domain-containing protein n=1 Tax=Thiomonas sp. FB-6 TaxID=1158291 RepID=UPI00035E4078|nr:DUF882 domain-containing protein [Thiomonas sp. FB-6]
MPPKLLPCPTRRRLLAAAAGGALYALPRRHARAAPAAARSLAFENLHTGESLRTVYWEQGQYLEQPLLDIQHLLRDYRNGQVHAIDIGLLNLLHAMREGLGASRPIQLISGYRSPATNAALHARSGQVSSGSLHMQGMAADIRIPGCDLPRLRALALSLRGGGVGYYPHSDFVHVDVGRVRQWTGA